MFLVYRFEILTRTYSIAGFALLTYKHSPFGPVTEFSCHAKHQKLLSVSYIHTYLPCSVSSTLPRQNANYSPTIRRNVKFNFTERVEMSAKSIPFSPHSYPTRKQFFTIKITSTGKKQIENYCFDRNYRFYLQYYVTKDFTYYAKNTYNYTRKGILNPKF